VAGRRGDPKVLTYSKYRGVRRQSGVKVNPSSGKYEKHIYQNKWVVSLAGRYVGSYSDEIEAAVAYDKAATKKWGDRAILNFPKGNI
jgi:hypothetical protein